MAYTHKNLILNGRKFSIAESSPSAINRQSAFEETTISFVKSWLSNQQSFTLQTSGSTGPPKEITLTRQQLAASAHRTIRKLGLSEKNTALVCLDTKYIAGKMMLVRALEANMKIVAVEPSSNPLKDLSEQPGFGAFVPLQLDEIFKDPASVKKLNAFQSVIVGGAAVSTALLGKIRQLSCDVYATYGMTETVSHIALQKLTGADAQDSFEVLPDIRIRLDERDCLVIEIPGFREPVVTNDLARITDDSHFIILGRHDHVINSGGIKLIPERIEKKLSSILSGDFFVAGIRDERLGQKLVLVVEGEAVPDLSSRIRQVLSAYEIPKEIIYTENFIRTDTQKINRLRTLEKVIKSTL